MEMRDVIEEIKLELTGSILELEIEDSAIEAYVRKALRELDRYCDEAKLITVPFSSCIDLTGFNSIAVVKVYRADGYGSGENTVNGLEDPAYAQQWMLFSNGGTLYNLNNYLSNYGAWTTLLRIKNTMSTDMGFKEDKRSNKLYINNYLDTPKNVTIEYIPKSRSVEDLQSSYWIDILIRLSTAYVKIALGRIRTRFTQSNALWTQDGEKLLEEGTTELKDLRDVLRENANLIFGID